MARRDSGGEDAGLTADQFGQPSTVSIAWGDRIRYTSYYHDDAGKGF